MFLTLNLFKGQQLPAVERVRLTNWAFVCDCAANNAGQELDDCPECDQSCCSSLLSLLELTHLELEFLYSSDYLKPLILKLLSFARLKHVTLSWHPVTCSINQSNFVQAVVAHVTRRAQQRPLDWMRLRLDPSAIALIDHSKKLPKNLLISATD